MLLGVSEVAVGAGLTVIVLDKELKVTGVLALSVAITLNVYEPIVEKLLKLGNVIVPSDPIVLVSTTLPAVMPLTVPGPLT